MKLLKLSILISSTFVAVRGFECPDLTCAASNSDGTCFSHDGLSPVTKIQLFQCPSGSICNIDDGNYAWYNTELQRVKDGTSMD